MHPRLLYVVRKSAKALTEIYKSSLAITVAPYDWKITNVVHLRKAAGISNYRPVNLIALIAKLVDTILNGQDEFILGGARIDQGWWWKIQSD